MTDIVTAIAFVVVVLGCFAIGAYLVLQGHPWFALLIIIVGSGTSITKSNRELK